MADWCSSNRARWVFLFPCVLNFGFRFLFWEVLAAPDLCTAVVWQDPICTHDLVKNSLGSLLPPLFLFFLKPPSSGLRFACQQTPVRTVLLLLLGILGLHQQAYGWVCRGRYIAATHRDWPGPDPEQGAAGGSQALHDNVWGFGGTRKEEFERSNLNPKFREARNPLNALAGVACGLNILAILGPAVVLIWWEDPKVRARRATQSQQGGSSKSTQPTRGAVFCNFVPGAGATTTTRGAPPEDEPPDDAGSGPLRFPSYWALANPTPHNTPTQLVPDDDLLPAMQALMTKTWSGKYTRDRKSRRVPSGCRVLTVLRVENPAAFAALHEQKQRIRRTLADKSCPPFWAKGAGEFLRATGRARLAQSLNEVYLFHGTSPEAAEAIARTGFLLRKAGSKAGCAFGKGVYLAESASKSDEYVQEGKGVFAGQFAMLICRCVLGRVKTVHDARDWAPHVWPENSEFDSLCADREAAVGTYRELILFDSSLVCPEYVAIYRRTE